MQKLLFMFFAVGCVYNIQAEASQVVESTTEQVEANETPEVKNNKSKLFLDPACPQHVDCKAFLKIRAMQERHRLAM